MLARIQEWQDGHGKPGGRAEAARWLDEAHRLLDEIAKYADRDAADNAWAPAALGDVCWANGPANSAPAGTETAFPGLARRRGVCTRQTALR